MKKITVEEIRAGDKIRLEFEEPTPISNTLAVEYTAGRDNDKYSGSSGQYFLIERPFEPHWGLVIGDPRQPALRAVYLPTDRADVTEVPWLVGDWMNSRQTPRWADNEWAKNKLANGWVVIDKPEDVK